MTKDEVRRKILEVGIVPVVRASSGQQAQMAVEAIWAGGIPIAEITMTVPGAIEVIAQRSRSIGSEVLIGAGTCLDTS
jgi:2-dehydro-3-deoxyphosphogluconate aldolase/(4S)-4-hydroxy-2-oxoglutarate aldolase